MVAYNFKKSFVPKIRAGTKRQTLRNMRTRHALPGEPIQLYTGMRTKYCEKIIEDPICSAVHPVRMIAGLSNFSIEVGGLKIPDDQLDQFAIDDGFDAVGDKTASEVMHRWWLLTHGSAVFPDLVLIQWLPEGVAA